ncbi:hypothetical protein DL766_005877 [Monosporascus sp. MC13-8B]|nr:hypothetical protein DL766_005877 [Monosporascus sp. MC13-8B]
MASGSVATAGDMNNVRDATFVTRSIPDVSSNAGLVALCTVPTDRAGPDDLGWHVSDFLAFKKLLSKHLHPKAQTWLAHCDIAQIVEANPLGYTHGKDRRILQIANLTGDIQVESSANELADKFLTTTKQKARIVKKLGYDLVILVCGPSTLEQDIFFGNADCKPRIRAYEIRSAMGLDDCQSKGMVITPALFSAGWQVNPCFCSDSTVPTRTGFLTFLAKQFGAIFASHILTKVTGRDCPMLDVSKLDHRHGFEDGTLTFRRRAEEDTLADKVHKALAARLMLGHSDHSFSFDAANDDWDKLIGPRRHKTLDAYKQEWEKLAVADAAAQFGPDPSLFGNLFGGTKASQLAHIKDLIRDSLTSWQGVWVNEYGRAAREKYRRFLNNADPDGSDCHEMFNVMEQRSTLLAVADLIVKYYSLPVPQGNRCRDYDATAAQPGEAGRVFGLLCRKVPWVYLHPDRGQDVYGKVQNPHQREAHYLAAAFEMNSTDPRELDTAMDSIHALFTGIQFTQLRHLFEDPDLRQKCRAWLNANGMPILEYPFDDGQEKPQEGYGAKKNIEADVPMTTVYMEDVAASKGITRKGNQPDLATLISGDQGQKRSSLKHPGLVLDKESDRMPPTAGLVPDANGSIIEASCEPDTVGKLKAALKTAHDRLGEDLSGEDFESVMADITNLTKSLTTEKIKRDTAAKNKATSITSVGSANISSDAIVQQNTTQLEPAVSQLGIKSQRSTGPNNGFASENSGQEIDTDIVMGGLTPGQTQDPSTFTSRSMEQTADKTPATATSKHSVEGAQQLRLFRRGSPNKEEAALNPPDLYGLVSQLKVQAVVRASHGWENHFVDQDRADCVRKSTDNSREYYSLGRSHHSKAARLRRRVSRGEILLAQPSSSSPRQLVTLDLIPARLLARPPLVSVPAVARTPARSPGPGLAAAVWSLHLAL